MCIYVQPVKSLYLSIYRHIIAIIAEAGSYSFTRADINFQEICKLVRAVLVA